MYGNAFGMPFNTADQAAMAHDQNFGFGGYQWPDGSYHSMPYSNQAAGAAGAASGGAGAGGGPQFGFNPQIASSYAKALSSQWNQARQANQQQLQTMLGLSQNYGQGQLAQSAQLTQQQNAAGQQNMASRGLYNSTIAQGLANANTGQQQIRDSQIKDMQTQQQLGIYGQNQITYPNLSAFAQLASQPGAFSGNSGIGALMGAMSKFNYGGAAAGGGAPMPRGR